MGERIDVLNKKGYRIIQDEDLYCFNMDAVLISDFAKAKKSDLVLDIGSGNGIIPLLMHARYEPKFISGIEITPASAELARRSIELNELEEKIEIINDDAKNMGEHFKLSYFDLIVSNPPYMAAGLKPKTKEVGLARHEVELDFPSLASLVAKHLKVGGAFYLVHRTYRLVDVLATLRLNGLEPKELRFVKPFVNKEPNIFLLKAVRGGKPFLKVLKDLVIYESASVYTEEVLEIYDN